MSLATDPYLADHSLLQGPDRLGPAAKFPIVPATGTLALIADAAAALVPERVVVGVRGMRALRPLAVEPEVTLFVEATEQVPPPADGTTAVLVTVDGQVAGPDGTSGPREAYARATVLLAEAYPHAAGPGGPVADRGAPVQGRRSRPLRGPVDVPRPGVPGRDRTDHDRRQRGPRRRRAARGARLPAGRRGPTARLLGRAAAPQRPRDPNPHRIGGLLRCTAADRSTVRHLGLRAVPREPRGRRRPRPARRRRPALVLDHRLDRPPHGGQSRHRGGLPAPGPRPARRDARRTAGTCWSNPGPTRPRATSPPGSTSHPPSTSNFPVGRPVPPGTGCSGGSRPRTPSGTCSGPAGPARSTRPRSRSGTTPAARPTSPGRAPRG